MPLDFQKIPIVFGQGIDSKTDRKMLPAGKLLELQNGVFKNASSISKRYGYDRLSVAIDGADSIGGGAALSTFRNELLLFDGSRVYARLEATDKWADRGQVISVSQATTPIISNSREQTNPDMAVNGGLAIYAWEDSRGGAYYSVLDQETGSFIISDQQITATGEKPKVVSLANFIFIFFTDGGSVKYRIINIATPSSLATEEVVTVNLSVANNHYDVCINAARIYVSFVNSDYGTTVCYVDVAQDISDEVTTDGYFTTLNCIANWSDQEQNVWTAFAHDGYGVSVYSHNYGLGVVLEETAVDETSRVMTICGIEASHNVHKLFYEVEVSGDTRKYVRSATVTRSGSLNTPVDFIKSVGLASKPFIYDGGLYINVAYQSPLQSTYFTLDSDARVVAKIAAQVAGGHRTNRFLPQVTASADGIYHFAGCQKGRIISELNTIFSLLGVISIELDFVNANNFLTAELGDNLYVIGGIVQSYDGVSFVEHNFHLYPDSSVIVILPNYEAPEEDITPPSVTITGVS